MLFLDKQNRKREREKKRQEQWKRATKEAEARLMQEGEEGVRQDQTNTADTSSGSGSSGLSSLCRGYRTTRMRWGIGVKTAVLQSHML